MVLSTQVGQPLFWIGTPIHTDDRGNTYTIQEALDLGPVSSIRSGAQPLLFWAQDQRKRELVVAMLYREGTLAPFAGEQIFVLADTVLELRTWITEDDLYALDRLPNLIEAYVELASDPRGASEIPLVQETARKMGVSLAQFLYHLSLLGPRG